MHGTALPATKTCFTPNINSAEGEIPADTAALVSGFSGVNPFSGIHITALSQIQALKTCSPVWGTLRGAIPWILGGGVRPVYFILEPISRRLASSPLSFFKFLAWCSRMMINRPWSPGNHAAPCFLPLHENSHVHTSHTRTHRCAPFCTHPYPPWCI